MIAADMEKNLAILRTFSLPGAGVTRFAFSDEDWRARAFIMDEMKKAGLSVRSDNFGNVIGRRAGSDPNAAAVMMGSHLDSVPNGGAFDGTVGVLSALAAIKEMNEQGVDNYHPIEMVVFMAEESSRFGAATLGSKAMCGLLLAEDLKNIRDKEKTPLYDVLRSRGFDPDRIADAVYRGSVKVFFELHIEQGKALEAAGKQIGVVTGIAAPTRLRVLLHGHADHSGATPMGMRHDGLCAAAEIILAVEKLAAESDPPCVGTVGIIRTVPCVMNVIPGETELGIDLRSIYADAKKTLAGKLRDRIGEIAGKRDIPFTVDILADDTPVRLNESVIGFLAGICAKRGCRYMKMPSGAGHDAMHWAVGHPTGMLFVPCKNGVSHHPDEYAATEDIAAGTRILYDAVCRAADKDTIFT
ncbi:MAG: Zn-dependent hydrolase [Acidaminococcales bacterium]|jgi:hydantoinase/carbamoylase family amidase|nr:Zn-dependent hydrolase [Acidaminococcales bacterium]